MTRSAPRPHPPARGAACGAGEGWPERGVRHARHLSSPHGAHTATPRRPHAHGTPRSRTFARIPHPRHPAPPSREPRATEQCASLSPPHPALPTTERAPPRTPRRPHPGTGLSSTDPTLARTLRAATGPPRAPDRVARALPGVHVCPWAGTGTAAGGAPLPSRPARSPGPSPRPAPRGGAERDGRREGGRWRSGGGGGQEAEAERAGRGPRGPVRHSGESAAAGAGRPRAKGAAAGPGAGRGGQRPPGAALVLCSRAGSREGGASGRSRARAWPRRPPRAPRPRRAPESDAAGEDGARIAPKLRRRGPNS